MPVIQSKLKSGSAEFTAAELAKRARMHGVSFGAMGPYRARACTHLDVTAAMIPEAVSAIAEALAG